MDYCNDFGNVMSVGALVIGAISMLLFVGIVIYGIYRFIKGIINIIKNFIPFAKKDYSNLGISEEHAKELREGDIRHVKGMIIFFLKVIGIIIAVILTLIIISWLAGKAVCALNMIPALQKWQIIK
jgi:hypothetical protein